MVYTKMADINNSASTIDREKKRKILIGLSAYLINKRIKKKRKQRAANRSCWQKTWIGRRDSRGEYTTLIQELQLEDPTAFANFHRVTMEQFNDIVEHVSVFIQRQDTNMRKAIKPEERLSVTLRYLATG